MDFYVTDNIFHGGASSLLCEKSILFKVADDAHCIRVPDNVVEIAEKTFFHCTALASVSLPDSLTSIGNGAFQDCSSLTSVSLPDSLTSIGSRTFQGCTSLKKISLPRGITSIGYSAFLDCSSLTSISIPDGITSIEYSTFNGCSALTSITLPEGLTSIEAYAFSDCSRLAELSLPRGITSIRHSAFNGCRSLTHVSIPSGITILKSAAFCNCINLRSINLPDSLTAIEDNAFCCCWSLKDISIPNGVTFLGMFAFGGCTSLEGISIPDSVVTMDGPVFARVSRLPRLAAAPHHLKYESIFPECGVFICPAPFEEIPMRFQTAACVGYAENEALYGDEVRAGYLSYIRTHAAELCDAAFKHLSLLRLMCREELIGEENIEAFLETALQRNDIELTALLIEYRSAHFSRQEDISLSLDDLKEDHPAESLSAPQTKQASEIVPEKPSPLRRLLAKVRTLLKKV